MTPCFWTCHRPWDASWLLSSVEGNRASGSCSQRFVCIIFTSERAKTCMVHNLRWDAHRAVSAIRKAFDASHVASDPTDASVFSGSPAQLFLGYHCERPTFPALFTGMGSVAAERLRSLFRSAVPRETTVQASPLRTLSFSTIHRSDDCPQNHPRVFLGEHVSVALWRHGGQTLSRSVTCDFRTFGTVDSRTANVCLVIEGDFVPEGHR